MKKLKILTKNKVDPMGNVWVFSDTLSGSVCVVWLFWYQSSWFSMYFVIQIRFYGRFQSIFSQFHLHSWENLLKITVLHLQSDFSQRREHVFSSNLLWQTGLCIWSMDNKAGYYSDSGKCLESTFHIGPHRTFTYESMIIVTLTRVERSLHNRPFGQ